ncbi:hypothetical protein KQI63_03455 [bacterium]|nr:hypothetical protein [bacterium]
MKPLRTARSGRYTVVPLFFFAVVLLTTASCDAPRDNTLDPKSPEYNPVGTGEVNDITDFEIVEIRSIHDESDGSQGPVDRLDISVGLKEPDGIEFVQLEVADTLRYKMNKVNFGNYTFTLHPSRVNHSIFDLSNSPFRFIVYDSKGYVTQSEPYYIVRILSHPPKIVQPVLDEEGEPQVLSSFPTIIWEDDLSSFFVEYQIKFFVSNRHGENKVTLSDWTTIPRILTPDPPDTVDNGLDSFRVASFIPPDESKLYHVLLAVKDRHGNRAISANHLFKIY